MLLYHFVEVRTLGLSDCILLFLALVAYVNYHPEDAGTLFPTADIVHPICD